MKALARARAALLEIVAAVDRLLGYPFERPENRVLRLRAELHDLDSWIPCLERYTDELRAKRQAIQLELFGGDTPDTRARLAEGQ